MNDEYFFISIGIFFFASLLLAYLRAFRCDQVLKSLEDFQVTMEGTDDRLVWGVMHLMPSGIEFRYPQGIEVEEHLETSYILYSSDYPSIQAFYRYADNLDEAGKARRARDIQRTFHPRPGRRLLRGIRNFTIIASASLNEVMGIFLGRIRKSAVQFISDEGSRALKDLSGTVIGSVGTSFDPLLERVIGQRVVFELVEGDVIHEHVGIFKDYSPDFLMFLDVLYPERKKLAIRLDEPLETDRFAIRYENGLLKMTNSGQWPILVQRLTTDQREWLVNAVVDNGETIQLPLAGEDIEEAVLRMQLVREMDMVVPRIRSVVRHRAESFQDQSLGSVVMDIVFDVGRALRGKDQTALEAELKERLTTRPDDAVAASELGSLLMLSGKLNPAVKWFRRAAKNADQLPDKGKRVHQELREALRRLKNSSKAVTKIRVKTTTDAPKG